MFFHCTPLQVCWSFASCLSQARKLTSGAYLSPAPLEWASLSWYSLTQVDLPQKGRFEAAEGPWICKVNIMALARTNWRWTFCTEIAWRCLQMSWFICGRVPRVNWHETSCSSAISHVVMAIGGTLVRLRGRVMTGCVREGVDGLGGWIGCYWSNGCVFWSFLLSWLTEVWVCQMILSCCTLEQAFEDELKLTSTETPDFRMGVDLCPNLIRAPNSDQLHCKS